MHIGLIGKNGNMGKRTWPNVLPSCFPCRIWDVFPTLSSRKFVTISSRPGCCRTTSFLWCCIQVVFTIRRRRRPRKCAVSWWTPRTLILPPSLLAAHAHPLLRHMVMALSLARPSILNNSHAIREGGSRSLVQDDAKIIVDPSLTYFKQILSLPDVTQSEWSIYSQIITRPIGGPRKGNDFCALSPPMQYYVC